MTESRRMRLAGSHDKVPQLLWTLLWAGALLTVAFTYLFGPSSLAAQILMTAVLTAMITLERFLISVLQHPFRGSLRVPPSELQRVIGVIRSGAE